MHTILADERQRTRFINPGNCIFAPTAINSGDSPVFFSVWWEVGSVRSFYSTIRRRCRGSDQCRPCAKGVCSSLHSSRTPCLLEKTNTSSLASRQRLQGYIYKRFSVSTETYTTVPAKGERPFTTESHKNIKFEVHCFGWMDSWFCIRKLNHRSASKKLHRIFSDFIIGFKKTNTYLKIYLVNFFVFSFNLKFST